MDMDFREPTRHYPQQPAYREAPPQHHQPQYDDSPPPQHHRKGGKGKAFFKFLLVLLLIAGAAAGAWYYRDKQAKDEAAKQAQQISDLQDQLNTARDAAAQSQKQQAQTTTTSGPSEDTVKKVKDAVSSGKFTDLKVLMGDKVNVVIAASEGLGSRTPDQAVSDLKYLASSKDWDFALKADVVATYQDGSYSVYFPTGALVGKSSDGHIVSFVFNDAGKITGIFMASNEKSLQ
ncbi:MAG TPA: hypothetical protein VFW52_00070 [Candidatus Saccharimonadales bacterium]|nr:hypothetical protein [Candidatus Saccharimonadales bacterium]